MPEVPQSLLFRNVMLKHSTINPILDYEVIFCPLTPEDEAICKQHLEQHGILYTDAGCHNIAKMVLKKLNNVRRQLCQK